MIASDWTAGFLDAVALPTKAWEPMITHDQAGIMMLPILLFNGDAELDAGADSALDEDVFLAEVPAIIPACVAGIHDFWNSKQTNRRPRSGRRRGTPRSRRLH